MSEPADAKIVSKLLDNTNYEIIKILKDSQHPFYVGELKSQLEKVNITKSKPTLDRRLKELESIGWVKRAIHGSYEHTKWEPYSATFYQHLLQHRKSVIDTVDRLKEDVVVAQVLPEAEKMYQAIVVKEIGDDLSVGKRKKIEEYKGRLRELIGWLLRDFDKLDDMSKMRMFRWAEKSKYFEKLPYS